MIKTAILTLLCSMSMLFSGWKDNSLKDITKPYLGEYECTQALFGGEDYLNKLEYVNLTLEKENNFILTFSEKGKEKQTLKGLYEYNKDRETIILKSEDKDFFKREFPLKKGIIYITVGIGEKTLFLQFKQK